jgi:hypothetical protein
MLSPPATGQNERGGYLKECSIGCVRGSDMTESIKQLSNTQLIKRIRELEKEVERLQKKLVDTWGSYD